MSEHLLKVQRKPFLDLQSGIKTGEIRNCTDRTFNAGDVVRLSLVDETGNPTGRELLRTITHVQHGYGLPDDMCVLSYGPQAPCCTPTAEQTPAAYTAADVTEAHSNGYALGMRQTPALGGEPEVLGWIVTDMNGDFYFAVDKQTPNDTALIDRTYVATLLAEIERLKDELANHDSVSKVMNAWVAEKGQMPWATAIKTLAIITKMPDEERDRLLDMDDGSTERGALIAERDTLKARREELEELLRDVYNQNELSLSFDIRITAALAQSAPAAEADDGGYTDHDLHRGSE